MTTLSLRAYRGDPSVKAKYVSRMKAHIAADELRQTETGWDGKGCAVYCTLNTYSHAAFADELEVPEAIGHLYDTIYEGLPEEDASRFALAFLEAIQEGADLSRIVSQFLHWLLTTGEPIDLTSHASPRGRVEIAKCARLHERIIEGGTVEHKEWVSVRESAGAVAFAELSMTKEAAAATAEWAAQAAWMAGRAAQAVESAVWAAKGRTSQEKAAVWHKMAAQLLIFIEGTRP